MYHVQLTNGFRPRHYPLGGARVLSVIQVWRRGHI